MFKKILVPLDGSKLAETALPMAQKMAQTMGSQIFLLEIAEPIQTLHKGDAVGETYHLEMSTEPTRKQAESYLAEVASRIPDVEVIKQVEEGDVAQVIIDTAVAHQIDLIIMSTHGRTGLRRLVFGSIVEDVIRHSNINVLIARSNHT